MRKPISVLGFARAFVLGALGYCVYFGSILIASQAENSITIADGNWQWGALLAFALASSELLVLDAWLLRERLLRRLILSCGITIASLLAAGLVCTIAGIELHEQRVALFWPRIVVAAPLFVALILIVRRIAKQTSRWSA